ncbi:MAG TPA: ACT domain-containing protein [Bacillus sp. (in: firmicutes)]|jgi:ACT domain-containing protein|nr:ACT domain-containing protein [Bacillus sp. (in: firmicutes)]
MNQRRAIVSVIGKDQVGIIAKVTNVLADNKINILDISQTILQDFFTMMMIVDVADNKDLESLQKQLVKVGKTMNLNINIQLEEIFQAMHRV